MADDDDDQNTRHILQKAADYHSRLQDMSRTMQSDDTDLTMEMEAEWTALRIALVCALYYHHKILQLTRALGLERQPARYRRASVCPSK